MWTCEIENLSSQIVSGDQGGQQRQPVRIFAGVLSIVTWGWPWGPHIGQHVSYSQDLEEGSFWLDHAQIQGAGKIFRGLSC